MIGPRVNDPSDPIAVCRFCGEDVVNTDLGREYHVMTCVRLIKHHFRLTAKEEKRK